MLQQTKLRTHVRRRLQSWKKKTYRDFEIKNLGEYYDLYLRSNVLLLADVFENFLKMCLEIYELDPIKFISAPGLAWQAALKNTKVELDLLTDVDILLMIKKRIRGGFAIPSIVMWKLIISIWVTMMKKRAFIS